MKATAAPFEIHIIDDNPVYLYCLKQRILEHVQFPVKTHLNFHNYWKGKTHNNGLVILDHYLEGTPYGKDEFKNLKLIKDQRKELGVIVVSSSNDQSIASQAKALGAIEFVPKNENSDVELIRLVKCQYLISRISNEI